MNDLKYRYWDRDMQIMVGHHNNSMLTLSSFFEQIESCVGYTPHVMPFVGIKDHTGQEVYEGDILRLYDEYDTPDNYQYHEVVWGGQDYPAFHLKPGFQDTMNDFSYLLCATEAPKFEVAGNIYENSKLLTQ